MKDLKQRALRGGLARVCSQGANFLLRMGSLMVLARLLDPKDFGLVGMVTAVIGVFSVFRDFGLSAAAVQRGNITQEQSSTLFWINLLAGAVLALLTALSGPFVARFYHEPRLVGVTVVLATGFLFNAAGVQHTSILERGLRFTALSVLDIIPLGVSILVGIGMAFAGLGYWALVATSTVGPLVYTIGVWITTKWIPGRPSRQIGIRSMLHFGGTLTLNGLVMYISSNLDKVLLGRFWGVEALGIYGRAFQLINIPTDNLNSAAGSVAFASLSRLQDDPSRLKNYFLKGYSLVLSFTVPITFTVALLAEDMIRVMLGPKWSSAITVFRLLAPTALAFAMLGPLGWLITSLGLVVRGLKMALVFGPLMVVAYILGLSHGPHGVAFAYSAMKILTVIPAALWAIHGTVITLRDILVTLSKPLFSGLYATCLTFGLEPLYNSQLPPLLRLVISISIFAAAYIGMMFYVMGMKDFFMDIFKGFIQPEAPAESSLELT